jgi:hypothetical protein
MEKQFDLDHQQQGEKGRDAATSMGNLPECLSSTSLGDSLLLSGQIASMEARIQKLEDVLRDSADRDPRLTVRAQLEARDELVHDAATNEISNESTADSMIRHMQRVQNKLCQFFPNAERPSPNIASPLYSHVRKTASTGSPGRSSWPTVVDSIPKASYANLGIREKGQFSNSGFPEKSVDRWPSPKPTPQDILSTPHEVFSPAPQSGQTLSHVAAVSANSLSTTNVQRSYSQPPLTLLDGSMRFAATSASEASRGAIYTPRLLSRTDPAKVDTLRFVGDMAPRAVPEASTSTEVLCRPLPAGRSMTLSMPSSGSLYVPSGGVRGSPQTIRQQPSPVTLRQSTLPSTSSPILQRRSVTTSQQQSTANMRHMNPTLSSKFHSATFSS